MLLGAYCTLSLLNSYPIAQPLRSIETSISVNFLGSFSRLGVRDLPGGITVDGGSDWVCLNKKFVVSFFLFHPSVFFCFMHPMFMQYECNHSLLSSLAHDKGVTLDSNLFRLVLGATTKPVSNMDI